MNGLAYWHCEPMLKYKLGSTIVTAYKPFFRHVGSNERHDKLCRQTAEEESADEYNSITTHKSNKSRFTL